jgi:hypothetical protein
MLDAAGGAVHSLDLLLSYPAAAATALDAQVGDLAAGMSYSANLSQPGWVRLALAGARPISGHGELIKLVFRLADPARGSAPLRFSRAEADEGTVPVHWADGALTASWFYLPLVQREH